MEQLSKNTTKMYFNPATNRKAMIALCDISEWSNAPISILVSPVEKTHAEAIMLDAYIDFDTNIHTNKHELLQYVFQRLRDNHILFQPYVKKGR